MATTNDPVTIGGRLKVKGETWFQGYISGSGGTGDINVSAVDINASKSDAIFKSIAVSASSTFNTTVTASKVYARHLQGTIDKFDAVINASGDYIPSASITANTPLETEDKRLLTIGEFKVGYRNLLDTAADESFAQQISTDLSTQTEKISTISTDLSTVTTDLSTQTEKISNVSTDLSTVTTDLSTQTEKISNVSTDLSTVTTDLSTQTTKITNVSTDLSTVTTDLSTQTEKISNVSSDLSTVTTDLSIVTTDLSTQTEKISNVSTDLSTVTTDLSTQTEKISNVSTDLSTQTTKSDNNIKLDYYRSFNEPDNNITPVTYGMQKTIVNKNLFVNNGFSRVAAVRPGAVATTVSHGWLLDKNNDDGIAIHIPIHKLIDIGESSNVKLANLHSVKFEYSAQTQYTATSDLPIMLIELSKLAQEGVNDEHNRFIICPWIGNQMGAFGK